MLRLRSTGGEPDLDAFWKGVSERRGGEVSFTSFATFLGRSGSRSVQLPGLLYLAGERFWFEDFEQESWLLRLIPPRRPFAKFEISFARADVAGHRIISRSTALRCLSGRLPPVSTPALGRLGRLLATSALQLYLRDGAALFFEVMREAELSRLLG